MNKKYIIPNRKISKEHWRIFMNLISTEIEYCERRQAQEIKGIDMDKAMSDHDEIMALTICECLGFREVPSQSKRKKFRVNNKMWTLENIIATTLTILEDYTDRIRYRFDNRQDGINECAMVLYKRFMDNVYIYRTPDLYKLTHQQDE